jgi:hypothetical protein
MRGSGAQVLRLGAHLQVHLALHQHRLHCKGVGVLGQHRARRPHPLEDFVEALRQGLGLECCKIRIRHFRLLDIRALQETACRA